MLPTILTNVLPSTLPTTAVAKPGVFWVLTPATSLVLQPPLFGGSQKWELEREGNKKLGG